MADFTVNDNDGAVTILGGATASPSGPGPFTFISAEFDAGVANGDGTIRYSYFINGVQAVFVDFDPASGAISAFVRTDTVDSLVSGQNYMSSYEVHNSDDSAIGTTTFEINGADDTATITATTTGAVTEDGTAIATGSITVLDVDANQNHALNGTFSGTYGTLTVTNGAWSYALNNAATNVQALSAGQQVTDSFTVSSQDGSVSAPITITIDGTNDAPVILAATGVVADPLDGPGVLVNNGAVTNNSTFANAASLNGLFGLNADPDVLNATTVPHVSIAGTGGGHVDVYSFSVATAGSTGTFDIDNVTGFDGGFGAGDTVITLFDANGVQIAVNDDNNTDANGNRLNSFLTHTFASAGIYYIQVRVWSAQTINLGDTYELQVSLTDPGQAYGAGNTYSPVLTESNLPLNASGTVYFRDPDAGDTPVVNYTAATDATVTATGITLTAPQIAAIRASFSVNAAGNYSFALPSPDYLNVGDTVTATFNIHVVDGNGGDTIQPITITINGTNDAPVVSSAGYAVTEDTGVQTTSLVSLASDVDAGAVLTFSQVGAVAGVTIAANGSLSVNTNNAAYQSIAAGEVRNVVVNFRVTDENNAAVDRIVTLQITGTNDAPVITSAVQSATVYETNATLTASGAVTFTDVDTLDAPTVTILANPLVLHPGFVLANADFLAIQGALTHVNGAWTFSLPSPDFLNDGQTITAIYTLQVDDHHGGTTTQNVTITINGRDEIFVGGAGSQTFTGTAFDDQIDGGAGFDTLNLSGYLGGVQVDTVLGTITGAGGVDTIANLENFGLTNRADTFIGSNANETVDGLDGDDDIETAGGNDIVYAGAGNDLVHGGSGAGDDYYDGGAGTADTLTYSSTTTGVVVDMNAIDRSANTAVAAILAGVPLPATTPVGLASGAEIGTDAFVNFENVTGGSGDDILIGNAGDNVLNGGGGNDLLRGNGGNDTLIGGTGIDTADYSGQTTAVQINLGDGSVNAGAQGGFDTVSGIENIILTSAADQFIGDGNNNQVTGGLGNDQLDGGAGEDTAIFTNTAAVDGLAVEVDVVGLHALVLGTLSGDGLDTVQNFEHLLFTNGPGAADDVIIDIVNANAVVATAADIASLNESELTGPLTTATGNVLANDINLDAAVDDVKIVTGFSQGMNTALAGGTIAGAFGSLTLNANGSYTYSAYASTNALRAGETRIDTFTYTADDGDDGTSLPATLTITINGVDDAAVITGATTGAVTEDVNVVMGDITASGTLTATDPDAGESGFVATTITRPDGVFNIAANGAWSFVANNSATIIQQIGAGDHLTEVFNVQTIGGTSAAVTVTINGANDNPISSGVSYSAHSGVVNVASASGINTFGTAFQIGNYYTLNADPNIFNATTVPHVTFVVSASALPDFFSYITTNFNYGSPNFLAFDVDGTSPGTDAFLRVFFGSSVITTSDNSGGPSGYDVTVANPLDPLILLQGNGGNGGILTYQLGTSASLGATGLGLGQTYLIHFSNLAATVDPGNVHEETSALLGAPLVTYGTVNFTDIDTNDTPQAAYTAATGLSATVANGPQLTAPQAAALASSFTINAAGAFTFNAPSPDYLGADDVLTLNYTVDVTDDHGGSTTQIVTIIINGNNDNPVITSGAQTATLTESANPTHNALTASGAVTATDIDNGDVLSFANTGSTVSYTGAGSLSVAQQNMITNAFTLNPDGTWGYDLASPDFLPSGSVVTLTRTVRVTDGNGGSASQNVVITINGANDAPTVVGPVNNVSGANEALNAVNQIITGGGWVGFGDADIGNVLTLSQSPATIVYSDADGDPVNFVADGLMTQSQYDAFVLAVSNGFTVNDTDGSLTDNQAYATWNFTYTAPSLDYLSAGETLVATVTVTATDAAGLTVTNDVSVIIYGSNDGPVLNAGILGSVVDTSGNSEYAPLTGNISGSASDLDAHDTRSFSLTTPSSTPYGTLTLNANGTYSFAVNSAAVNALQLGTNPVLTFGVRVTDSQGATSDANFTISLTGANDVPVVSPLNYWADDNQASVNFNLLSGAFDPDNGDDIDVGTRTITLGSAPGTLTAAETNAIQTALNTGGLVINSETGAASFDARLFDTLDPGQSVDVAIHYQVTDSNGSFTNNTTIITVYGALEIVGPLTEFDDGPVNGGNFGDYIDGLDGDDVINGGGGNDEIIGGLGDDRITGGSGLDYLDGGDGDDSLNGGSGEDRISGGAGADVIQGGSENDYIDGGSGADRIDGGDGVDTVDYRQSNAAVNINLLAATFTGGDAEGDALTAVENINGSEFNDIIIGNTAVNTIYGNGGDDILEGGSGADFIYGGSGGLDTRAWWWNDGEDTASYATSNAAVTVNLDTGVNTGGHAQGDLLYDIDNLIGSAFVDTLTGSSGNNVIEGGAGADIINGGDGVDTASYVGSASGVTVNLGTGTHSGGDALGDTLTAIENLRGSAGVDTLTGNGLDNVIEGGAGNDILDGGAGNDTVSYAHSTFGVTVHLDNPTPQDTVQQGIDTLVGFENILGSNAADSLWGDGGDNIINGGAGFDFIVGGGGSNTLIGGTDGDIYIVQGVNDAVVENEGGGYDIVLAQTDFTLAQGSEVEALAVISGTGITLTGNDMQQVLTGGAGDDTINALGGNDLIISGGGTNILVGGNGDDIYYAQGVNDIVTEGSEGGFDVVLAGGNLTLASNSAVEVIAVNTASGVTIVGSDTNQTIQGGSGNDRFVGGLGNDVITGSGGADTFVLRNTFVDRDFITDFTSGTDKIEIDAGLFGGGLSAGGLTAAQFLSGAGVTMATTADQRFIYDSATGNLYFDADGNGAAASVLMSNLTNVGALTASDFVITGSAPAAETPSAKDNSADVLDVSKVFADATVVGADALDNGLTFVDPMSFTDSGLERWQPIYNGQFI
jgi:VCBS repeat-containing protein